MFQTIPQLAFKYYFSISPPSLSAHLYFSIYRAFSCLIIVIVAVQFTRDWFLTRFRLLAEDILVDQERLSRRFKIWERARQLNPVETQSVAKLQGLLERGIQVLHHELSGKIVEAVLRYSSVSNDLQLFSRHEGIFMSKETVMVSFSARLVVLPVCTV